MTARLTTDMDETDLQRLSERGDAAMRSLHRRQAWHLLRVAIRNLIRSYRRKP